MTTLKDYAKKYKISVLNSDGTFKSVNKLSLDIYDYERNNQKKLKGKTYYPFLRITKND
jgi:hypothetical protein